jgi:phage terminase large subunit-like protein
VAGALRKRGDRTRAAHSGVDGLRGAVPAAALPAGGGVWKQSWFRFYRRSELAAITKFDYVVASWDCAFKDLHNSDFVCSQLWAVRKADFYLLDEVHARLDFPGTLAGIRSLCSRSQHRVHAVLVEDKANGPAVISVLRSQIPGMLAINPEGANRPAPQL